jgi:hypothetical protein
MPVISIQTCYDAQLQNLNETSSLQMTPLSQDLIHLGIARRKIAGGLWLLVMAPFAPSTV